MRVLIAADSAVERIMLERFVKELGHECLVAQDGAQAWELFQTNGADVLISDWMMPGLDGAELCRRVRAHPGAPYAYIILLTVLDDEEHTRYGMQAGADDYLRKPLRIEDLEMRLIAAERVSYLHRQLWNRETRREHTHDALLRLAQQVAALSDPHELATTLLAESTVLLDGSAGVISTCQAECASLTPLRSTIPEARGEAAMHAAQRVSSRAVERRGPAILSGSPAAAAGGSGGPAAVAVPLVHEDGLVGALAIVSFVPGKRFTPDDAQLLLRLAAIGAAGLVGLERARGAREAGETGSSEASRLPAMPSSLIGRDAEVERLSADLLRSKGTVFTLTGPAGVGKTRLAVAAAARVAEQLPDGAVFVDLAGLERPAQVVPAIARALGGDPESGLDWLRSALAGRALLLVLDTFEHVLGAASDIGQLLTSCASLKMIVTSRAALRLRAEQVVPVAPLAVPDLARPLDLAEVGRSPAVALFADRARAALPSFSLSQANARAVAEICARLEGLPLAIELAAARTNVLTPEAMRARLEHPLELLSAGERDRPARHHTLRQAIAWSRALLDADAQRLFRELAAFAGGFTLEAVAAVSSASESAHGVDDDRVLESVGGLLENSLLYRTTSAGGAPRFRMLDTIRAYAREQSEGTPELDAALGRHAAFFLGLLEHAVPRLRGAEQATRLEHLAADSENLLAALRFAVESGNAELALRFVAGLSVLWQMRGLPVEAQVWLERALAMADASPPRVVAGAFAGAGHLALLRRDWDDASHWAEAGVQAWRELGDQRRVAESLADLALVRLGQTARTREARALARDAAALAREHADAWTRAHAAHALGETAVAQGNYRAAAEQFQTGLRLWLDAGDQWRLAAALEGLAVIAAAERRAADALRLSGAAARVRQTLRAPLSPAQQEWFERRLAPARAELGGEAAAATWAEGQALELGDVVRQVFETDPAGGLDEAAATEELGWLTRREQQVTALVALGLHNYEIGERLGITRHTAEIHVSNVLSKLGMNSRAQLAAWAVAHGLLQHGSLAVK
jgi:non-specific serine/threonine protein kinase